MGLLFLNPDDIKAYRRIIEEEVRRNPEFKAYYEVRETIFNYFHKIAFMPVKHCVYKVSENSYQAIALENIEKAIDYREYPEGSREEFISCKSPVVQAQAKKHSRGRLVAEVGFFGQDRKYLLRPNEKDKEDEKSMFFPAFFMTTSILHPLLLEPDFGDLYYQGLWDYIFQGLDLNPYIDMTKNPDIPLDEDSQAALPPVLSYKMDIEIRPDNPVYERRQEGITFYVEALQKYHTDRKSLQLLAAHFGYRSIAFKNLNDYGNSVQKVPELYDGTSPFLLQAYEEYKTKKDAERSFTEFLQRHSATDFVDKELFGYSSFVEFLRRHPATLSRPDNSQLLIPFVDEKRSLMAQLFRRFNEYADCIQKHSEESVCESIEDKQAFMKFMLDSY